MLVSSFFDLLESNSIIHYIILCLALTVIPLFNPAETIVITSFNFIFEAFIILVTGSDPLLIVQCAVLTLATVFISQMLTSGYIALEIANDRIKEADDTLECLAQTDKLTGLLNKHGLEECLEVLWPQCMRENTNVLIAGITVDYLKDIYEKSGDEAGDECVKKVAKVLRSNCKRSTDIVARYGDDQFAIFITGIKNDNIVAFMEKIRGAVESAQIPAPSIASSDNITVSIGVVSDVPTQTNCETLFAIANEELENAKECGCNCISYNNVIY